MVVRRMKKAGICLTAALYMLFYSSFAVNGMADRPPAGTEEESRKETFIGLSANDMTVRSLEYERQGALVIEALGRGNSRVEQTGTEARFSSDEGAHSFGRYFNRYIYLGKEPVTLYSVREGEEDYAIFFSCDNPGLALGQHRQVQDKLAGLAGAARDLGDREKAEFFYQWIYNHVSYDESLQNRTVYHAVMEGKSVCWGYVSAYLSLCRMAGLTCEPVYRGNHAWNRIWLDGQWIYCDITWDKCLGGSTWKFMTQEEMDLDFLHNGL